MRGVSAKMASFRCGFVGTRKEETTKGMKNKGNVDKGKARN